MTSLFHHPHCKPYILHPIESVKCFFLSVKWAYQRIKKGYCDRDLCYGIDDWLVEILPNAVDEIRKRKHSIPCSLITEAIDSMGLNIENYYDICSDVPKETIEEIDRASEKMWNDILLRISFLLRESREPTSTKENPYEKEYRKACEANVKANNPSFSALQKRFFDEEDRLRDYREDCKKEAIALLVEWSGYLDI